VVSLVNTEENWEYSGGRMVFSLAASAAAASSVAAVRRAITGDPIGIKQELHRMIRWRGLFSQALLM